MSIAPTASVEFVAALFALANRIGFDSERILLKSGVSRKALGPHVQRVPIEHLRSLWCCAADLAGRSPFGLRAAEQLRFGDLGSLDQQLSRAGTFGQAIDEFVRHSTLLTTAGAYSATVLDSSLYLTHRAPGALRHLSEFAFGVITLRARESLGSNWRPVRVGFMHAAPSDVGSYREFFDGPVLFGEPFDYISFDREALAAPFRNAGHGQPTIAPSRRDTTESFSQRVRAALRLKFLDKDPSIEAVARHLGLSTRTLQRRLRADGSNHRQMLDELRFLIATNELEQGAGTQQAIAQNLCYADRKSLNRAFHRWLNDTPGQRRQRTVK